MRIGGALVSRFRVTMRLGRVFVADGVVTFTVMLSRRAVSLRRRFVMLGGLRV